MTLPVAPPPTDNLYKFVALSSAIIAVFLVYLAHDRVYKMQQSTWEIEAQIKNISTLQTLLPERRDPNSEADETDVEKFIEVSMMISQLGVDVAKLHQALSVARTTSGALITLSVFFGILSCIGFYFWYHRVQKLLDAKLRRELDELENTDPEN